MTPVGVTSGVGVAVAAVPKVGNGSSVPSKTLPAMTTAVKSVVGEAAAVSVVGVVAAAVNVANRSSFPSKTSPVRPSSASVPLDITQKMIYSYTTSIEFKDGQLDTKQTEGDNWKLDIQYDALHTTLAKQPQSLRSSKTPSCSARQSSLLRSCQWTEPLRR